jgi:hypothetical protein
MSEKWTPDRIAELKLLQELLREAQAVNHGSGALKRIQRCEEIARILTRDDLVKPRASFALFLERTAAWSLTGLGQN